MTRLPAVGRGTRNKRQSPKFESRANKRGVQRHRSGAGGGELSKSIRTRLEGWRIRDATLLSEFIQDLFRVTSNSYCRNTKLIRVQKDILRVEELNSCRLDKVLRHRRLEKRYWEAKRLMKLENTEDAESVPQSMVKVYRKAINHLEASYVDSDDEIPHGGFGVKDPFVDTNWESMDHNSENKTTTLSKERKTPGSSRSYLSNDELVSEQLLFNVNPGGPSGDKLKSTKKRNVASSQKTVSSTRFKKQQEIPKIKQRKVNGKKAPSKSKNDQPIKFPPVGSSTRSIDESTQQQQKNSAILDISKGSTCSLHSETTHKSKKNHSSEMKGLGRSGSTSSIDSLSARKKQLLKKQNELVKRRSDLEKRIVDGTNRKNDGQTHTGADDMDVPTIKTGGGSLDLLESVPSDTPKVNGVGQNQSNLQSNLDSETKLAMESQIQKTENPKLSGDKVVPKQGTANADHDDGNVKLGKKVAKPAPRQLETEEGSKRGLGTGMGQSGITAAKKDSTAIEMQHRGENSNQILNTEPTLPRKGIPSSSVGSKRALKDSSFSEVRNEGGETLLAKEEHEKGTTAHDDSGTLVFDKEGEDVTTSAPASVKQSSVSKDLSLSSAVSNGSSIKMDSLQDQEREDSGNESIKQNNLSTPELLERNLRESKPKLESSPSVASREQKVEENDAYGDDFDDDFEDDLVSEDDEHKSLVLEREGPNKLRCSTSSEDSSKLAGQTLSMSHDLKDMEGGESSSNINSSKESFDDMKHTEEDAHSSLKTTKPDFVKESTKTLSTSKGKQTELITEEIASSRTGTLKASASKEFAETEINGRTSSVSILKESTSSQTVVNKTAGEAFENSKGLDSKESSASLKVDAETTSFATGNTGKGNDDGSSTSRQGNIVNPTGSTGTEAKALPKRQDVDDGNTTRSKQLDEEDLDDLLAEFDDVEFGGTL